MPQVKKILISLPDTLLREVDELVDTTASSRSEFIREAMRQYIKQRRSAALRESLKNAYIDMGEINLTLAEQFIAADTMQQFIYEKKLAESE